MMTCSGEDNKLNASEDQSSFRASKMYMKVTAMSAKSFRLTVNDLCIYEETNSISSPTKFISSTDFMLNKLHFTQKALWEAG